MGLLLTAVMHHVDDKATQRDRGHAAGRSCPGAATWSSPVSPGPGPEYPARGGAVDEIEHILHDQLGTGHWREADVVRDWFGDWTLVEPGVVPLARGGRTEADPPPLITHGMIGGVARKD